MFLVTLASFGNGSIQTPSHRSCRTSSRRRGLIRGRTSLTASGSASENWSKAREMVAIVGVRVHPVDAHIWEPLAVTRARLVYCGGESGGSEFSQWAERVGRTGLDRVLEGYFADSFDVLLRELGLT